MSHGRSLLVLILLAAAGCAAFKAPPPDVSAGPRALSDANIAAIVKAENYTDISYAQLVPSHAERQDIREFGQRMLTDHTGVNGLVDDLLRKLDVTPEDNQTSLDMRDESAAHRDTLRELTGYAFDSTYIENEVRYHTAFLASIDSVLIPKSHNADLRALLTSVRPAVAAHLAHAEQVRANVVAKR
jgi:putative membrane protein